MWLMGVFNEWYKNGQKRYQGSYVNDMMHGKWIEWYKNGQKKLQETYDYGLENGLITEWYENGFKKSEGSFKKGNEDGNFSRWVINGQKWQQGFYKNGQQHGLYEVWHVGFAWISKSIGFSVKEENLYPIWKQRNHKRLEIIFDEGKFISAKGWKINGEQCPETNLKDGFGIIVEYGDGGLVYERKSYVDGKEVELSVFEAKKKSRKASASHILVSYQGASRASPAVFRDKDSAKKEAERIRSLILIDGNDFAEMARFYSDDPSGPKGGDIGEFTYEIMAKSFSEATFALPVGGISEVVETEFGFHIIKRTPVKSISSSVDASTAKPTPPPSFTPPTAPPSQVKP